MLLNLIGLLAACQFPSPPEKKNCIAGISLHRYFGNEKRLDILVEYIGQTFEMVKLQILIAQHDRSYIMDKWRMELNMVKPLDSLIQFEELMSCLRRQVIRELKQIQSAATNPSVPFAIEYHET
jgi:hypothetical protein